jgi:hypothetical protein
VIFLLRFCAFLNKGSSKTPQKTFWGKSMSKAFGFWPKKLREKKFFSFRLFPSIFFNRVFGRFSA